MLSFSLSVVRALCLAVSHSHTQSVLLFSSSHYYNLIFFFIQSQIQKYPVVLCHTTQAQIRQPTLSAHTKTTNTRTLSSIVLTPSRAGCTCAAWMVWKCENIQIWITCEYSDGSSEHERQMRTRNHRVEVISVEYREQHIWRR